MLRSLNFRRLILTGMAGAALVVGAGCDKKDDVKKPETDPSTTVFDDFAQRVDGYMKIRKSVVDSVGELDPTKSQTEITARSTALANGLLAARAEAKQGDIFTPEFAALVATLIKEEYKRRSISVQETRSDQQDELPDFNRFPNWEQLLKKTEADGTISRKAQYGPYLVDKPVNPSNGFSAVEVLNAPPDALHKAGANIGWVVDTGTGRLWATDEEANVILE